MTVLNQFRYRIWDALLSEMVHEIAEGIFSGEEDFDVFIAAVVAAALSLEHEGGL